MWKATAHNRQSPCYIFVPMCEVQQILQLVSIAVGSSGLLFIKTQISSSMSISSSFRLFSHQIPQYLKSRIPLSETLISFVSYPSKLSFSSISIQRIPTKTTASSSSVAPASMQPIEELPPKLREIAELFQAVKEPKAKYEQLLFYGRNLAPLDARFKTSENKVQGCVSQVWVRAYLDSNRNVQFEADSDSVLTKGLAALLVQGFSGRPVPEILKVSPDFVVMLGLQQSLTPSRNNGFLNMLKLMQKKALQLYVEAEKGDGSTGGEGSGLGNEVESMDSSLPNDNVGENLEGREGSTSGKGGTSETALNPSGNLGSRGERIKDRLKKELHPVELEVEDISYQHAGHEGVRGYAGETHFNLRIVSEEFEGKSLVKRHRLIYDLLKEELESGLHALSIIAKTPTEVGSR